jgi:hypothetical protein
MNQFAIDQRSLTPKRELDREGLSVRTILC